MWALRCTSVIRGSGTKYSTRFMSTGATDSVAVNNENAKVINENKKPLKTWRDIPGPPSLPIIGPLLNFLPGIGSLGSKLGLELSDHLYKSYGPVVRFESMLGRPAMLFLFEPEAFAQVLRGENNMPLRPGFESLDYYRKEYNKTDFKDITGLMTDHGQKWKYFRSTVNPVMLQPKTIKLYSTVLDNIAQDVITRIKTLRDENNMIKENFDSEMNKWGLESLGVVALGGRLGCLDPDLPEDSPARELIQCVHDIFDIMLELDFKPSIWRYYHTKTFQKAMDLNDQLLRLSKNFVNKAMVEIQSKNRSASQDDGVLEKLLAIDEEVAVIMATDMLFAGVDTTANAILILLYLLGKNPDKQELLRQEVLSGDERRQYMKACIKESMRLMPIVSGNLRQTTKEYNIEGYKIPTGTRIIFGHQYMSVQESQYYQADKFIPERWLVAKDDQLHHGKAHPFTCSPFGFGVRQCIGKRIAGLELETLTARMVRNFEIGWVGEPINIKPLSLNYVKGPYNYVFKDLK